MKGSVQSSDLEAILAAACQVSKSPDPIRIIFERIGEPIEETGADADEHPVEAGQIRVIAYNDSITSEWRRPAEVSMTGSVAIVADGLNGLVRTSKGSEASFLLEDTETDNENALRISTSRSAHEFPTVSEVIFEKVVPGHTNGARADLSNLARAIETAKVSVAARADAVGAKIALTGVHIRQLEDTIEVVGTDGRRLAITRLNRRDFGAIRFDNPEAAYATLPIEAIPLVCSMLNAGPAHFEITQNTAIVESGAGSLSIRLIDLPFPNYAQLLNLPAADALTLSKSDLEIALQRSSVTLAKDRHTVAVKLSRSDDGIYITSTAAGQSSTECVSQKGGSEVSIGFDPRYMLAAIGVYGKGDIELKFGAVNAPIRVESRSRTEVTMLVMPCKIA